jgi:hypothetical protein
MGYGWMAPRWLPLSPPFAMEDGEAGCDGECFGSRYVMCVIYVRYTSVCLLLSVLVCNVKHSPSLSDIVLFRVLFPLLSTILSSSSSIHTHIPTSHANSSDDEELMGPSVSERVAAVAAKCVSSGDVTGRWVGGYE